MELLLPRQRRLDLRQTRLMAILNVTPDSFSDGGRFSGEQACLERVSELVAAGAEIIDIGGESTRPGAADVTLDDELQRVIPVLNTIRRKFPDLVISVDTSKAEVMRQAALHGADILNDVRALQEGRGRIRSSSCQSVAGLSDAYAGATQVDAASACISGCGQ